MYVKVCIIYGNTIVIVSGIKLQGLEGEMKK